MEEYTNNQQPAENPQPAYQAPQPAAAPQPAPQPTYQAPQPVYQAPQPVYQAQPVYNPAPVNAPDAKVVMVFGIIAIALASSGLLGLIFSIIAKKKASAYRAAYGSFTGMAKVGNILASIALPVSIVMTVIWAIYIVVAIIAGLGAAAYSHSYNYLSALL